MAKKIPRYPEESYSPHELAVPINGESHIYVRAGKNQVTLEIISTRVGEDGDPSELSGSLLAMSPDQFKRMTQMFLSVAERLLSVETH
jgi:hypothetical protein